MTCFKPGDLVCLKKEHRDLSEPLSVFMILESFKTPTENVYRILYGEHTAILNLGNAYEIFLSSEPKDNP